MQQQQVAERAQALFLDPSVFRSDKTGLEHGNLKTWRWEWSKALRAKEYLPPYLGSSMLATHDGVQAEVGRLLVRAIRNEMRRQYFFFILFLVSRREATVMERHLTRSS